jgi:hypothetical protein
MIAPLPKQQQRFKYSKEVEAELADEEEEEIHEEELHEDDETEHEEDLQEDGED